MLFSASSTYAPGQPRGYDGQSLGQDVGNKGHYDLSSIKPPNLVIGIVGLVVLAILVHKYGGRKR